VEIKIMATFEDFQKIDIRVGKIIEVKDFEEARSPSYKIKIDFGELGIKVSSAQITKLYSKENLLNRQIVAVVNFPPKKIAGFKSKVLILGAMKEDGEVILLQPEREAPLGYKIG
jgi:tRNA-binding protein